MRIYIANLGKYNEGELVGAWFTPPVDFEEVTERIGLNDEYDKVNKRVPVIAGTGSNCTETDRKSVV